MKYNEFVREMRSQEYERFKAELQRAFRLFERNLITYSELKHTMDELNEKHEQQLDFFEQTLFPAAAKGILAAIEC